ncbi:MAG: hypothetical protein AAFN30_20720 [Actinomycetota bacterium]
MTEIPEHLLKRSKAAKSAKSGDGGDDDAPTASSGDAAPVAAAAAAPAIPTEALPNLDPEPEPPAPEPVYVTASKARTRIPVWALPMVVAIPVWAYSFAGTMQQPEVEDVLFVEGEIFYAESGCSGCHGANGGGGSGYALSDGSVLETFPEPIDMMVHVARGSAAIIGEEYGGERSDGRRVAGSLGQMPAQEEALDLTKLEIVVWHERAVLSGEDTGTPGYEEWMDHMREAYESGDETPIDLELLLACADPAITPGATGPAAFIDEATPCPGPAGFAAEEEAALSE